MMAAPVTFGNTAATAFGRLRARHAAWAVPALVAACFAPPQTGAVRAARAPVTSELYELANIRHSNVVPKSSPSALVAAFRKFCLDGPRDPAALAAKLRAADYVAVPEDRATGVTAFVVDDQRPMVLVADDGRSCAVGAVARTGQTARIRAMIAQDFPAATPLDPTRVSPNTELAVATGTAAGRGAGAVIFLQRLAPTLSYSRLILGISHSR